MLQIDPGNVCYVIIKAREFFGKVAVVDSDSASNTADDGITPSHTKLLHESIGHDNKEIHWIEGANHYYFGQPNKAAESAAVCVDWLQRQGLVE